MFIQLISLTVRTGETEGQHPCTRTLTWISEEQWSENCCYCVILSPGCLLGGKRTVLFNLLCLMKNPPDVFCPDKDLWSSFSCPLSGLNSCVLPLKSKSWNSVLSFLLPDSCFQGSWWADGRLHSVFSSLQLLHLHLSKPKLHSSAHLNVRTVQAVVLLSATNEVGPKTWSANMNVFLPCSVCVSSVLG